LELQYIKGIGPKRLKLLNRLGVFSDTDLLNYFPRRYEDRSQIVPLAFLTDGQTATVKVFVKDVREQTPKKGMTVLKAYVGDESGNGTAVWFNQPFLKKQILPGSQMLLTGKAQCRFGQREIVAADYQAANDPDELLEGARIIPVYPLTEGLSQRFFREVIRQLLSRPRDKEEDLYPEEFRERYGLIPRAEAARSIHFPEDEDSFHKARKRLVFDELFLVQLALIISRNQMKREDGGVAHTRNGDLVPRWLEALPFALTAAQRRVMEEVRRDMESLSSMQRLVQGDVGSGKTAVAAFALLKAVENGCQSALMAPTEILARQHFETLFKWFAPLGVRIGLLTGALSSGGKKAEMESVSSGETQVVVGTHALFQENIRFRHLTLLVIDEQHRFGVKQRALMEEKGFTADVLVMSATPIPRTLALTLYGDLDISSLDELPPGRKPVETFCVLERARGKLQRFIGECLGKGRQVYVVCPLIEESETLDLKNAKEVRESYARIFSGYSVGLLHGRMKPAEKAEVMEGFVQGRIHVLVTTTVIEVGVNVPQATVMVVESAERFGLAQLHQLRGRVGRGEDQSHCILVTETKNPVALKRMKLMTQTNDGFKLAEEDMVLRGPGEFFGSRQHGLPDFKLAKMPEDAPLLESARQAAVQLLEEDPLLRSAEHRRIGREVGSLMDAMVTI
jgi:ATP-dependent DNA helicase RecG